jgi:hypothetical protein
MIKATKNGRVINMMTAEFLPIKMSNGYQVVYYKNEKHYVHKLVATDWLSGYCDSKVIQFRDGDKTNCHADNLYLINKGDLDEFKLSYFKFVYEREDGRYIVIYKGKSQGIFDTDVEAWETTAKRLAYKDEVATILDGKYKINKLGIIYDIEKSRWLASSRTDGKIDLNGKRYSIATLCYNAFNEDKKQRVKHKDGNKSNNIIDNLI